MKTSVLSLLVVVAAAAALSFAQSPPSKIDGKKDAAALELDALRMKCDALGAELAETKGALEQVVKYLEAQAQTAKAMEKVLDDAEAKGFTFGINPDSRIALLAGWRDQCAVLQKDVPVLKAAKKDPAEKPAPKN
ncbi:MAG: hypothetical protein HZA53_14000 [Planctomycetes bacterium]|nr:hypothetical protein [Planctomycetota bacterium]